MWLFYLPIIPVSDAECMCCRSVVISKFHTFSRNGCLPVLFTKPSAGGRNDPQGPFLYSRLQGFSRMVPGNPGNGSAGGFVNSAVTPLLCKNIIKRSASNVTLQSSCFITLCFHVLDPQKFHLICHLALCCFSTLRIANANRHSMGTETVWLSDMSLSA